LKLAPSNLPTNGKYLRIGFSKLPAGLMLLFSNLLVLRPAQRSLVGWEAHRRVE
jgi:hypothetical protein